MLVYGIMLYLVMALIVYAFIKHWGLGGKCFSVFVPLFWFPCMIAHFLMELRDKTGNVLRGFVHKSVQRTITLSL